MFGKLALRNVRRSARDYLVYVLTMTFVVSLMFAFNSIIFSKDLQKMYEMAAIMADRYCHILYCTDRCMADQLYGTVHAGKKEP